MRRLGLFAILLTLVGLATAFAASFSVQTEDVASWTTNVSISPPGPAPFPNLIYVRGNATAPPGTLDLQPPPANDNVTGRRFSLSTAAIEEQTDTTKYFMWRTPEAPTSGYLLKGTVKLFISQNGAPSNRMTAGLFNCPSSSPIATTTIGPGACTIIRIAVGTEGAQGGGYQERTVTFLPSVDVTILAGNELRLKIVNRQPDSAADWDLQWGYLPSRKSRLEITQP